jgi:hypothetical protein
VKDVIDGLTPGTTLKHQLNYSGRADTYREVPMGDVVLEVSMSPRLLGGGTRLYDVAGGSMRKLLNLGRR